MQNKIFIGSSGWSYPNWKGKLYPHSSTSSEWLYHYAKIFDYVEVDHTFYHTPDTSVVKRWAQITPPNFRFTVKFPRAITHSRRLANVRKNHLDDFYSAMNPLSMKNLAFLIQLPSSFTFGENGLGLKDLENLFSVFDNSKRYRYAIEFRDYSLFNDKTWEILQNYNICMVWNQLSHFVSPPVCTTNYVYLRLIGDSNRISSNNKLEPTVWRDNQTEFLSGKNNYDNQKRKNDPLRDMQNWAKELNHWMKINENNKESNTCAFAVISINNFYMGYGPSTINIFGRMLGLPDAQSDKKQLTLFDFQKYWYPT